MIRCPNCNCGTAANGRLACHSYQFTKELPMPGKSMPELFWRHTTTCKLWAAKARIVQQTRMLVLLELQLQRNWPRDGLTLQNGCQIRRCPNSAFGPEPLGYTYVWVEPTGNIVSGKGVHFGCVLLRDALMAAVHFVSSIKEKVEHAET